MKNLPVMWETQVEKIPWRREWLSTSVFLPGEFHEQKSLVGYSPWGHKKLDAIEQLTLSLEHYLEAVARIVCECTYV